MPSGPIVCRMTLSSMNSTADSAMFCTPVGTSFFLPAAKNRRA